MFSKRKCDVLVVGAGPVGLFAALRLAERDIKVEIIDGQWRTAAHSYALALHPASLEFLDRSGLAEGENHESTQRDGCRSWLFGAEAIGV